MRFDESTNTVNGSKMKLKNVLIVVKDIERSKKFYHDVFRLDMILDNDGNRDEQFTDGMFRFEKRLK